jgi:hypothetical protein
MLVVLALGPLVIQAFTPHDGAPPFQLPAALKSLLPEALIQKESAKAGLAKQSKNAREASITHATRAPCLPSRIENGLTVRLKLSRKVRSPFSSVETPYFLTNYAANITELSLFVNPKLVWTFPGFQEVLKSCI